MKAQRKGRKLSHDYSTEALFSLQSEVKISSAKGQLKRPFSHIELNNSVRNDTEEKQV